MLLILFMLRPVDLAFPDVPFAGVSRLTLNKVGPARSAQQEEFKNEAKQKQKNKDSSHLLRQSSSPCTTNMSKQARKSTPEVTFHQVSRLKKKHVSIPPNV
mmetsp:Transcript_2406/g.3190  ORF Transcript_2406/g.3190 Transcript_2406/m.3190 type:complete len:101 (+) Transcript_2406:114-416(+)